MTDIAWIKSNYPGYRSWKSGEKIAKDFNVTGGFGKGRHPLDVGETSPQTDIRGNYPKRGKETK